MQQACLLLLLLCLVATDVGPYFNCSDLISSISGLLLFFNLLMAPVISSEVKGFFIGVGFTSNSSLAFFWLKKSLKYFSLTCSSSFVGIPSSESTNSGFLESFLLTVFSALKIVVA